MPIYGGPEAELEVGIHKPARVPSGQLSNFRAWLGSPIEHKLGVLEGRGRSLGCMSHEPNCKGYHATAGIQTGGGCSAQWVLICVLPVPETSPH